MIDRKMAKRSFGSDRKLEIDERRKDWYERVKNREGGLSEDLSKDHGDRENGNKGALRNKVSNRKSTRARHHRIRNSCRRPSCRRHTGHHNFQAKNRRAVERDYHRHTRSLKEFFLRGKKADIWFKNALRGKANEVTGQSSVEYALIGATFIAIVIGLGAMSNLLTDGVLVSHAAGAASHVIENAIGGATDVFSF